MRPSVRDFYIQPQLAGMTTCLFKGTVSPNPGTWSSLGGIQLPYAEVFAPFGAHFHPATKVKNNLGGVTV